MLYYIILYYMLYYIYIHFVSISAASLLDRMRPTPLGRHFATRQERNRHQGARGKRKKFTTGIPVDLRGTILTILS